MKNVRWKSTKRVNKRREREVEIKKIEKEKVGCIYAKQWLWKGDNEKEKEWEKSDIAIRRISDKRKEEKEETLWRVGKLIER